jgi:hypothetical protein
LQLLNEHPKCGDVSTLVVVVEIGITFVAAG